MVIDIHDRVPSYNYWITYGNGTKLNRTKFSVNVFKMNFNIPINQRFRNWIQFLKFQFSIIFLWSFDLIRFCSDIPMKISLSFETRPMYTDQSI